jgi:site-specific recombinase XerD
VSGEVAASGRGAATPARLSPAARAAVAAGMPESTRRAYTEDIKRFAAWCAEHGRGGLPTDGTTLTEYATHVAYDCGWTPVSIERARWAIVKWHSLAEVPPPSTDGLVGVLKGYREALAKSKSPKAKPRKATPASRSSLVAMLATLDRSTAAGKRNAAIILLGFAIAGRRGEIASLDIGDLDFQDRGLQVSVYRQKTRKMDDPVVQYRPDRAVCPVHAVAEWTGALGTAGPTAGPLFVRIDRHGRIGHQLTRGGVPIGDSDGRMTGQAVADVIHRSAISAGLSGRWSGHSLRRGLATSMHQAGAERRQIERQGGWEAGSRAVSGYIEDADRWLFDVLEGVL